MPGDFRSRLYARYYTYSYAASNRFDDVAYRQTARVITQLLSPHLPADRSARILEVACGIGYTVEALKRQGYEHVQGIDVSPEQVELARRRGLPVVEAEALAYLEERSEFYDAIVAFDFIEHLDRDEVLRFLDLSRRALKRGGRLVVKTPNASSPIAARARYRDFTHELIFTERSLEEVLLACDLRPVAIVGERWRPSTLPGWARAVVAGVMRAAWRVYLVAELGREGATIATEINLIAVAERP